MAKVKAAYNYSYNYEGKKISFKKDEEFQLLNKSNTDWWQVRRYMDGSAQDIYVPAVYVKEVNESPAEVNNPDPTYMNLDDIKVPSGEAGSKKAETGGGGNVVAPKVLNKPKNRPSFKRGTHAPLARKTVNTAKDKDVDDDSPTSPTSKSNGINPAKPVSPSVLRKFGQGGGSGPGTVLSSSQGAGMLSGIQRNHSTPATSGPGNAASLPRGEKLAPPAPSSKPRSKTNAEMLNDGLNPSVSDRVSGEGGKGKLQPPVQTKPKPQSKLRRPVSVVGGEQDASLTEVGSKPLVSELSNILKMKNPHLAGVGEHKPLAGTRSLNLSEASTALRTGGGNQFAKPAEVPAVTMPPAPEPAPPSSSALPAGWTEHNAASGQVYYYNAATGQSSWSRPRADSAQADKYLEKVAPRGWTKEINPITSTPVYTNSRTGERWSLASDGKGNYYYYNMANSTLTIGELPEVSDTPQENLYDTLGPPTNQNSSKSPAHSSTNTTTSGATITETIAASLSDVLKRHGILHRKRLFDLNGKKVKDKSWLKHYVCLQGYELLFYPDMKAKDNKASPTFIFCLLQSTVSPYNKDKRKNNVFQVSSHLGEQFLLQAETSNLLNEWYSTIQSAIDLANHDFKEDPDKFKRSLVERLPDELEEASRISSLKRDKRPSKGRHLSVTDETIFEGEDETINDFDISAADRSTHIRGRLRKLMAKRPEKEHLRSKGILQDPVFGCELSALCERQGTSVPKFFVQFIEHIEKEGLDVVGIYRLSGNAASVNKLRYLVEQDEEVNLDSEDWSDVNIVTGCLKLYLRELPDPLIPFRLYKPFIDAARGSTHAQRVQNITGKVKELPSANCSTLKLLIQHLRRVVEKGSINKMLATNVAIVFGPTVMRAEVDSIEMATLMPIQNGIIEIMVNEYDTIFRK